MLNKNKDHAVCLLMEIPVNLVFFKCQQTILIIRNVCGFDVHKDSVFMCILKKDGEKIEEKFEVLTPVWIDFVIC